MNIRFLFLNVQYAFKNRKHLSTHLSSYLLGLHHYLDCVHFSPNLHIQYVHLSPKVYIHYMQISPTFSKSCRWRTTPHVCNYEISGCTGPHPVNDAEGQERVGGNAELIAQLQDLCYWYLVICILYFTSQITKKYRIVLFIEIHCISSCLR